MRILLLIVGLVCLGLGPLAILGVIILLWLLFSG